MQELIITIVKGLVDDKDAVSVTVDEPKEDGTVVYHLHVSRRYGTCHRQTGQDCQGDPYNRKIRCRQG